MPSICRPTCSLLFCLLIAFSSDAVAANTGAATDTDRDGLSDKLEQRLLEQFSPRFMIAREDCAGSPAEFRRGISMPEVVGKTGTIYGQVFPVKGESRDHPTVEIHFYHLWDRDCGPHGHLLDTEHVALLARASGSDAEAATWKALYWYAAAHEDTVCDVSQIARASALHAEDGGATVFVSVGKHASYLSERLCRGGCGADRCEEMTQLKAADVVNLGERGHPMNGSDFIASTDWPLEAKMTTLNFPQEALSRLDGQPEAQIVWLNPGRHPVRGAIAKSVITEEAIAESGSDTTAAVGGAMGEASGATGNALQKSYGSTAREVGRWARRVGRALGAKPGDGASTSEDKPK